MKTLICKSPGKFEYAETDIIQPDRGELLVKINKIGICGTDLHAFAGNQAFFSYPRILGHELAGEIAEGQPSSAIKTGSRVAVIPYLHCGKCKACLLGKTNCCESLKVLGVHTDGGMREFLSVPMDNLILAEELTDDEIAIIEPLAIGAHAIRRAGDIQGKNVAVVGCGPIGMGIIAQASAMGAKVFALDLQPKKLQIARRNFRAHEVIDIKENPVGQLKEATNGQMADIVFDATGNKTALETGHQFMGYGGIYVLVGLYKDNLQFHHPSIHAKETTLLCSRNATKEDFFTVIQHLKDKNIPLESYITHRIPFEAVQHQFSRLTEPTENAIKALIEM